ncbi:helix-turn-helix domain-containing protein [Candidatus Fukatsuia endosymbiont of Tuberolachnus salignus]|uniref:helix-turn-helix domain-containing protein n=1 Tax=Candidatus Fukatsuia endosymbiont of Tuberolachnus salignus TaxID=3077957 RepID=UPI00313CA778
MKNPGQRIKNRRLELKITQKELASRVGVAHVTISQWERNDTSPRGDRLLSLSEALHCEASWVLRGDVVPNTPLSATSSARDLLTPKENVLLDLFSGLPASEQEQLIAMLKEKKRHYTQLLTELLHVRDKKKA